MPSRATESELNVLRIVRTLPPALLTDFPQQPQLPPKLRRLIRTAPRSVAQQILVEALHRLLRQPTSRDGREED